MNCGQPNLKIYAQDDGQGAETVEGLYVDQETREEKVKGGRDEYYGELRLETYAQDEGQGAETVEGLNVDQEN